MNVWHNLCSTGTERRPEKRGGRRWEGVNEEGWSKMGGGSGGGRGRLTDRQIDSWRSSWRRWGRMERERGRIRRMRSRTDRDRAETTAGGWWKIPPGDLAWHVAINNALAITLLQLHHEGKTEKCQSGLITSGVRQEWEAINKRWGSRHYFTIATTNVDQPERRWNLGILFPVYGISYEFLKTGFV